MTKSELSNHQLVHEHGGNGFVMVQDVDAEYCRLAFAGPKSKTVGRQAFLAWKKKLSIEEGYIDPKQPALGRIKLKIADELKPDLEQVRAGITNGSIRIVETHMR